MLPVEYVPTDQYMQVYHNALKHYAKPVANAVGMLADKIIENKGKKIVLVSLARAGIPIGILVKRYIKFKYGINVPHYSISIIRGRGIDDNAMKYLLEKYRPQQILLVDGWFWFRCPRGRHISCDSLGYYREPSRIVIRQNARRSIADRHQ